MGGASSVVTLTASALLGVPWDLQGQAVSTSLIPDDALSPESHLQVQVQRPADQGAQTPGPPGPQRHPPSSACLGSFSVPQPPDPIQSSQKPWARFLQNQSGLLSSLHPRFHLPPQAPTCCPLGAALAPCSPLAASLGLLQSGLLQEQPLSNSSVSSDRCNPQLSQSTFCLPASLGAIRLPQSASSPTLPMAPWGHRRVLTQTHCQGDAPFGGSWIAAPRISAPVLLRGRLPDPVTLPLLVPRPLSQAVSPWVPHSLPVRPSSWTQWPPCSLGSQLRGQPLPLSWEGAHLTGTAVGTGGPAPWWPHPGRRGPAGQPSGARGRNISLLSAGISPRDFTWASGSTSSEKSSPDTSVQTPVSTPSLAGKQVPVSTALLPGPPRPGDRHAR